MKVVSCERLASESKLPNSELCLLQYANIPDIDFDTAETEKATQVIDLVDSRDPVEYPVP